MAKSLKYPGDPSAANYTKLSTLGRAHIVRLGSDVSQCTRSRAHEVPLLRHFRLDDAQRQSQKSQKVETCTSLQKSLWTGFLQDTFSSWSTKPTRQLVGLILATTRRAHEEVGHSHLLLAIVRHWPINFDASALALE